MINRFVICQLKRKKYKTPPIMCWKKLPCVDILALTNFTFHFRTARKIMKSAV
jgi:hypothetical protein